MTVDTATAGMGPPEMATHDGPFAGHDAASFQRKEEQLSADSATTPGFPRMSTAQLLFWIPFACVQPVCVALLGVLTRYLQFETTPAWPAARLITVLCLIAAPLTIIFHLGPSCLLSCWRYCRGDDDSRGASGDASGVGGANSEGAGIGICSAEEEGAKHGSQGTIHSLASPEASWKARHPKLHRFAAAFSIAAAQSWVLVLMIVAPRLVDASVTQLVSMFTVVGVAIVGSVWLGLPIPRVLFPAAAVMIGGACMVLIPNIINGDAAGSLDSGRGWLGFAASVGVLLGLIVFISLVQAFKYLGISPFDVMHLVNAQCLIIFLPLSLGVDGTDWRAQFDPMTALDWTYLFLAGNVGVLGMIILSQLITLNLGGLVLSMFFAVRFLSSIALSKAILGSTIITSGLQIAGVVLVAGALTAYMVLQWWAARASTSQAVPPAAVPALTAAGQQPAQYPSSVGGLQRRPTILALTRSSMVSDTGLELGTAVAPCLDQYLSRRLSTVPHSISTRLRGKTWGGPEHLPSAASGKPAEAARAAKTQQHLLPAGP